MTRMSYLEAGLAALRAEMQRDTSVWALGEDLGRGGVFGQYRGLQDEFGAERIVDFYRENGPTFLFRNTLIEEYDQFKLEGYFTLLVGQKVPYCDSHPPSEEECRAWRSGQQSLRDRAQSALTVKQALAAVASPAWRWHPGFYRP